MPGSNVTVKVPQKARTKKITLLDCPIKPGEPEEGGTGLHAELLINGSICHLQSHRFQSSVHFENYLTRKFTNNICSLFYFRLKYGLFGKPIPSQSLNVYRHTVHREE